MTSDQQSVLWHQPFESPPGGVCDVLIIGAGPAGSTAAIHLAHRGYQVLLLDRERFPRDKTCGDVLIPDALRALERVGLRERVQQLGYQTCKGSLFSPSCIEYSVPGQYVSLKRRLLDALIAQKAVEAGVFFCHAKVESLSADGSGLVACALVAPLKGEPNCRWLCRARVAVIATGADVTLPRQLGMVTRPRPSAFALRCYIRSKIDIDRLVASCDRSIVPGYAWIFPLGNGEYNVGCGLVYRGQPRHGMNLRKMFRKFMANMPLARNLLEAGQAISPLRGARLRCGLRGVSPFAGNGIPAPGSVSSEPGAVTGKNLSLHCRLPSRRFLPILAIGETIGSTFPATGEGIGKAMETAELAAEVIDDALGSGNLGRLQEFPDRLEARFRLRYRGYEVAEHGLAQAWLHDLVARRARRSQFLQQAIAGIINETVDPRTVYSWRGVSGSFW